MIFKMNHSDSRLVSAQNGIENNKTNRVKINHTVYFALRDEYVYVYVQTAVGYKH